MSRTKKAGKRGPEGQQARQALKEQRKKQKETKKAKLSKLNPQQKTDLPPAAAQQDNTTQITGPEPSHQDALSARPSQTTSPAYITPFGDLAHTHNVAFMNIISSSQIEKKVTSILAHLSTDAEALPEVIMPAVVMLHSKAPVTAKMISVLEIAKREIAAGEGTWFQYNVVGRVMAEREREEPEKETPGEEEEEGFETMKTPFERAIEGKERVRAVPTLTTYLARVRIDGLRRKYGEQTNGVPVETSG